MHQFLPRLLLFHLLCLSLVTKIIVFDGQTQIQLKVKAILSLKRLRTIKSPLY